MCLWQPPEDAVQHMFNIIHIDNVFNVLMVKATSGMLLLITIILLMLLIISNHAIEFINSIHITNTYNGNDKDTDFTMYYSVYLTELGFRVHKTLNPKP